MTSLSVTIITLNEEKNIRRCIESVKGVADEIIVVDSFSADKTREICMSLNVIFIEHAFAGYIIQKNFALSKASSKYVLSLDADESLSEELARSVLDEKEKDFPADGYTMNRFNFYCGKWIKHGSYYPDRKLRLLNTQKGKWGGTDPHDKIEMQESALVKQLNGDLLHYTYQSFEAHQQKARQFSSIAAKALFEKGKRVSWFKLLFSPAWAFFHGFILKLGFLDGYTGFMIAKISANQSHLKYKKLIQLYKEKK